MRAASLHLRCRQQRFLHQGAIRDHGEALARLDDFGAAQRNGEIGAGIGRAVVGLAVQPLVFQEQDRVVRAQRRAQQPAGIGGVRGHHHPQPGNVSKQHLAALAVIDAAAVQVAADGHADYGRAAEAPVGAPAQGGHLVANLHHRRPDVIEELDFGHRLEPARGHADGAAHNRALGQRGIEYACPAELRL